MAAAKNEKKLTPHFEWCQDMDRILMKIKLPDVDVSETKLDITRDSFSFSYGAYEINFNFRFPVNPKTIKYRATRVLELVIEKDTSNAYWPHLLPKADKKKFKHHCKVDWNRFMDEEDAKKGKKGVVDDDDEYGNLNMGGMNTGGDESSEDDSDDKPIDDLEQNDDKTDLKQAETNEEEEEEEEEEDEMPPLENEEQNVQENADKNKKQEIADKKQEIENDDAKKNEKGDVVAPVVDAEIEVD